MSCSWCHNHSGLQSHSLASEFTFTYFAVSHSLSLSCPHLHTIDGIKRALGLQSLFVESSFTQLTVDHFKFLPCQWSSGGTLLGKWWWWWDVVWAVLLAINCNLSGDSCDKLLSLIWSKITCTEVVSRAEKETSFSIFHKVYVFVYHNHGREWYLWKLNYLINLNI